MMPPKPLKEGNTNYNGKSNTIAVSIGANTNYKLLGSLGREMFYCSIIPMRILIKNFSHGLQILLKLPAQSVTEAKKEGINLSKIDAQILEKVDPEMQQRFPDNNFVVLNGKCQETAKLYLMKL